MFRVSNEDEPSCTKMVRRRNYAFVDFCVACLLNVCFVRLFGFFHCGMENLVARELPFNIVLKKYFGGMTFPHASLCFVSLGSK
jgi:hypothetical protein